MAELDPNTTARFWLDYEVANVPHTMQVRFNAALVSAFQVAQDIAAILAFLEADLPSTWLVTGARVAPAGSDISLPYDLSDTELFGFAGTNTNPFQEVNHPRQLVWVGRSPTTGRRVRLSLYGGMFATPPNYRLGPGEDSFSSAPVIAALNAASRANRFVAIDGSPATWYSYVNVNFNSHWETQQRSS